MSILLQRSHNLQQSKILQKSHSFFMHFGILCFFGLFGSGLFGQHAYAENPNEQTLRQIDATASDEVKGFQVQEFRIGVGVTAERWSEEALAMVYDKSGKLLPTVTLSYRFHKRMALDVAAATGRLTAHSDQNEFRLMPVTVGASLLFGNDNVEPFIGVGAGFIQFSETLAPYGDLYSQVINGTKLGVDSRAGVRIATRLVPSSQHPGAPKGPSQLDIELGMGYRVHQAFGIGNGLNMNAFHSNVGVNLRF